MGLSSEGEIFVSENQGNWVPACKFIHIEEGAFHGCRWVKGRDGYDANPHTSGCLAAAG